MWFLKIGASTCGIIVHMETYFSVDIEADGPIPGPYSMSSFAIVAFAVRTNNGDIIDLDVDDPKNCFYAELKPISENFVPEAAAIAGLDRDDLIKNGQDPTVAMLAAAAWIEDLSTTEEFGKTRAVFSAYPLGYDWMWFYWYLMNFAKRSPFGHSTHVDIKSYFAARADKEIRVVGKRAMPSELKSKRPHTHNALDDAREQGELARNLFRWRRSAND
jgi:hypothetical protein